MDCLKGMSRSELAKLLNLKFPPLEIELQALAQTHRLLQAAFALGL